MAATVDSSKVFVHGGLIEQHTVLSALTSDLTETIAIAYTKGAPYKTAPLDVTFEQTAAATDGSPVTAEHLLASDSTSGNTIAIKARVGPGEDISGAKLKVKIRFLNAARQDSQSITTDNTSDNG
jgi:hypothetical protein